MHGGVLENQYISMYLVRLLSVKSVHIITLITAHVMRNLLKPIHILLDYATCIPVLTFVK